MRRDRAPPHPTLRKDEIRKARRTRRPTVQPLSPVPKSTVVSLSNDDTSARQHQPRRQGVIGREHQVVGLVADPGRLVEVGVRVEDLAVGHRGVQRAVADAGGEEVPRGVADVVGGDAAGELEAEQVDRGAPCTPHHWSSPNTVSASFFSSPYTPTTEARNAVPPNSPSADRPPSTMFLASIARSPSLKAKELPLLAPLLRSVPSACSRRRR